MYRWTSSVLNPEPASAIIQLEESGILSLDDSIWPVEQASIIYQVQLSYLCSNENRAAVIIYCHMSIIYGVDLDRCSIHPAITKIEKQFQCNGGGVNLQPSPWDLN